MPTEDSGTAIATATSPRTSWTCIRGGSDERLADDRRRGRQLSYTDIGDPNGQCIFFFHGAPTSRLQLVNLDEQFAAHGLRVVSPDRPGYGKSSPQPNRSITDWPADVVAVADALAIRRFIVAGHSSGGPYAVACAALLPDRVSAGLVIAGVTDMGWPPAWEDYIEAEIKLMRMSEEKELVAWCVEHFGADGSGFLTASGFELPEPDNALFADGNAAAALISNVGEAFRQGVAGYAQDIFIQGADRGRSTRAVSPSPWTWCTESRTRLYPWRTVATPPS